MQSVRGSGLQELLWDTELLRTASGETEDKQISNPMRAMEPAESERMWKDSRGRKSGWISIKQRELQVPDRMGEQEAHGKDAQKL